MGCFGITMVVGPMYRQVNYNNQVYRSGMCHSSILMSTWARLLETSAGALFDGSVVQREESCGVRLLMCYLCETRR